MVYMDELWRPNVIHPAWNVVDTNMAPPETIPDKAKPPECTVVMWQTPVTKCAEDLMDVQTYRKWFSVVKGGRTSDAREILRLAQPTERMKMIGGTFVGEETVVKSGVANFNDSHHKSALIKLFPKIFTKPLVLATISRSQRLVEMLLTEGAPIDIQEDGRNNIVHLLVLFSCASKNFEEEYIMMYKTLKNHILTSTDGPLTLKALLHEENGQGFRPLELACRLGCYKMLQTIFDTEGVYRLTQDKGLQKTYLYDVTEYVKGDPKRKHKSPLITLQYCDYKDVGRDDIQHVYKNILKPWADRQRESLRWVLGVWTLFRLVYMTVFLFISMAVFKDVLHGEGRSPMNGTANVTGNGFSSKCVSHLMKNEPRYFKVFFGCSILLFVRTACMFYKVFFDLCIYFKHYTGIMKKEVSKRYFVNNFFFKVADKAHLIMSFGLISAVFLNTNCDVPHLYLMLIVSLYFNIWSFLYFLQAVPFIGHYVIVFQHMLAIMAKFLFLYFLLLLTFSIGFYIILPTEYFTDPEISIYSTFLVMLNMVPVINSDTLTAPYALAAIVLHFFYVLIIMILMLNFLIAMMSDAVTRMTAHKEFVTCMYKLDISRDVERQLMSVPCVHRLYLKYFSKRFEAIDGRLYFAIEKVDNLGE